MFRDDLTKPFMRTMGCSSSELLGWLPRALPGARLIVEPDAGGGRCRAVYVGGELLIEWRVVAPRRIALLSIPQTEVRFSYDGLPPQRRRKIQTAFDLATQRGGG
ncbi:MAG: hypothetical protein HZA63_00525 [Rhodocyclales bacterium]|nr:hypothetical protein [Rhodocyclales bacterium]